MNDTSEKEQIKFFRNILKNKCVVNEQKTNGLKKAQRAHLYLS